MRTARKLKGRTGRCGPETGHDAGKTGTRGQKLSWRYPGEARGDAQQGAEGGLALLPDHDWRARGGGGVGWLLARHGGLHCVRNFCQVVSSGWGAGAPVRSGTGVCRPGWSKGTSSGADSGGTGTRRLWQPCTLSSLLLLLLHLFPATQTCDTLTCNQTRNCYCC